MGIPHSNVVFWAQIIVPTVAGLLGVLIGGLITSHNQKKERQHRRIREQLEGFYSVLLGMKSQIRAKSSLRVRIRAIAEEAYKEELKQGGDDPQVREKISKARWPQYEKIFEYDERQLVEEIVPLYRDMLTHMTKNMGLAEPSTLVHYDAFVEFVEIWNRGLQKTLPTEVVFRINHEEKKLYPFYEDLDRQATRLREELKK